METKSMATPFTSALIEQLDMQITGAKKTRKVVAAEIGIHYNTMNRYLNGERDIPMKVVFQIVEATGDDPEAVIRSAQDRAQTRAEH